MNKILILSTFLFFLLYSMSCSIEEKDEPELPSQLIIIPDGKKEFDAVSGSTILSVTSIAIEEFDTVSVSHILSSRQGVENVTPLSILKEYLVNKGYKTDTAKLAVLNKDFYSDLYGKKFDEYDNFLVANLQLNEHSMIGNDLLIYGNGYYFANNSKDIGVEVWEIDTTKIVSIDKVIHKWKNKYPSQLFFSYKKKNFLYVLYSRFKKNRVLMQDCISEMRK